MFQVKQGLFETGSPPSLDHLLSMTVFSQPKSGKKWSDNNNNNNDDDNNRLRKGIPENFSPVFNQKSKKTESRS